MGNVTMLCGFTNQLVTGALGQASQIAAVPTWMFAHSEGYTLYSSIPLTFTTFSLLTLWRQHSVIPPIFINTPICLVPPFLLLELHFSLASWICVRNLQTITYMFRIDSPRLWMSHCENTESIGKFKAWVTFSANVKDSVFSANHLQWIQVDYVFHSTAVIFHAVYEGFLKWGVPLNHPVSGDFPW